MQCSGDKTAVIAVSMLISLATFPESHVATSLTPNLHQTCVPCGMTALHVCSDRCHPAVIKEFSKESM